MTRASVDLVPKETSDVYLHCKRPTVSLNGYLGMNNLIANNPTESDGVVQSQQQEAALAHDVQEAQPNGKDTAMSQPRQIRVKSEALSNATLSKSKGSTNGPKTKAAATVQPFDLEPVAFPSEELKTRMQPDDLKDELLMTICSAFASVENRALCPKEIAAVCMKLGWECT